MKEVSLRVEVTELDGAACDRRSSATSSTTSGYCTTTVMAHLLRSGFNPESKAKVLHRAGQEVDVTQLGALPEVMVGLVTTTYAVTGKLTEEPSVSTTGVEDL